MAKTALLAHDVQTIKRRSGDVGAFVTHFARLLREMGEDVTILVTRMEDHLVALDSAAKAAYLAQGIQVRELHTPPLTGMRYPLLTPMRLAETVAPHLTDFDIVYLQDWYNVGFHALRQRRYRDVRLPVAVTVLHGASQWERTGNQRFPEVPHDLNIDYLERYAARHSDVVISPSRTMIDHVRAHGWSLADEQITVIGLPYFPPMFVAPLASAATRKLIYYGQLETRKGFEMFVSALMEVSRQRPELASALEKVVFLGANGINQYDGNLQPVWDDLRRSGYTTEHLADMTPPQSLDYLAANAHDSVIVIPSISDNFPYSVIEASHIPGVRLLAANVGGIPEILGADSLCLFAPYARALTSRLVEHLGGSETAPPIPAPYDEESANRRWRAVHEYAISQGEAIRTQARHASPIASTPTVDVCITYFNKGTFLEQLLLALAHQTSNEFTVYVIDDGSTDANSIAIFDRMRDQYATHGWTFVRAENRWVDAARNAVAEMGTSEYLVFIDADDVPSLNMIERYLTAIRASGDDALVCSSYLFVGDALPYDIATGKITAPNFAQYIPLGANAIVGLIEPIIFGGPMLIVRRSVFMAVGGYREWRGVAHEDWELHARLMLAGYKTDVLPEFLHFYRRTDDGLAMTADNAFRAKQRIVALYEAQLAQIGMRGAGWALFGLYNHLRDLDERRLDVQTSGRLAVTPFHLFPVNWHQNRALDHRLPPPPSNRGSRIVTAMRDHYRALIPLETRLRLHATVMRVLGRQVDAP